MAGVPAITVDGDTATGRQNFLFVEKEGQALRLGRYEDTFARLADGWRFASRRIVFMKLCHRREACRARRAGGRSSRPLTGVRPLGECAAAAD